jgi:hypothetical protein
MKDFFVSYNKADRSWAEWIAWHLEESNYTTVIQEWDFRPGCNFVLEMQKASVECDRTIAILSPEYLGAQFTQPEWAAAFAVDPQGWERKLVPVKVRPCRAEGILAQITYIDLVGVEEPQARERLLTGVNPDRAKPSSRPVFPAQTPHTAPIKPAFPGSQPAEAFPRAAPESLIKTQPKVDVPGSDSRHARRSRLFAALTVSILIVTSALGIAYLTTKWQGHPGAPETPDSPPPSAELPAASFTLEQFKELKDFAYARDGLDLSTTEAAKWAEDHIRYSARFDLARFKELFAFALSSLALPRDASAQWAEKRIHNTPPFDLTRFTAVFKFAYSGDGLDFDRAEAAKWAEARLRETPLFEVAKFKQLFLYATDPRELGMPRVAAADWALAKYKEVK